MIYFNHLFNAESAMRSNQIVQGFMHSDLDKLPRLKTAESLVGMLLTRIEVSNILCGRKF